jgi:hypothetical protein
MMIAGVETTTSMLFSVDAVKIKVQTFGLGQRFVRLASKLEASSADIVRCRGDSSLTSRSVLREI